MNQKIIILLLLLIFIFLYKDKKENLIQNTKNLIENIPNSKIQNSNIPNSKILIITAEDRDDTFIKYHDINFNKYCNLHGYTYIRVSNCSKNKSTTYWCKIHLINDYLKYDYDYIVWADSDTIISDMDIPLEKYINKYDKEFYRLA
jgi:hypothetical protein